MSVKCVITTWICGSHMFLMYVFAVATPDGQLLLSQRLYSTPEGARKAAKRRLMQPLPGVFQGHAKAAKALGVPMVDNLDAWKTAEHRRVLP